MNSKQREQRERNVRALLETINDPYQLPRHQPVDSGPAASKRVPCETCLRTGWVTDSSRVWPCGGCGGRGWRRRRKGDQEWDEYLNMPVATAGLKPPAREFKLDEDIRRLWFEIQKLERVDEPDNDDLLKALSSKDWLEKRGSYRELRRALAVLERRSPCVWGAVQRVYLRNVDTRSSRRFRLLEEIGVAFLAQEMRGPIRIPHAYQVDEAQRRVKGVVELAGEGMKAGEIARRLMIPKRKVQRILAALGDT